jgi:agmatine/peptidylarginine deiminase
VYCVVSTSYQSQAQNSFQSAGVNMNNVTFVNAPTDSYWIRDYGPWYIFEDRNPAIVDNVYNRPRPNDDEISGVFANYLNIPMYGMNLEHTGGNMMEDGRGHGVSDNLVLQENSNNETNVRNKMRDYLGIGHKALSDRHKLMFAKFPFCVSNALFSILLQTYMKEKNIFLRFILNI